MRKTTILLCFTLALVVVIGSGCTASDYTIGANELFNSSDSAAGQTSEPTSDVDNLTLPDLNDPVDPLLDLTVKIKKKSTKNKIIIYDTLVFEPDGKFIVFDVQVKNRGSQPVKFYLKDFSAADKSGNEYVPTALAGSSYLNTYEVLNPKAKYKTKIIFDVARGTKKINLKFNGGDVK